jgi:hypothetical protein
MVSIDEEPYVQTTSNDKVVQTQTTNNVVT